MKFTGSSVLLSGAALLAAMSTAHANLVQAHVKPLAVKAGGLVTVTMNFFVEDYVTERPILAGASTDPAFNFNFLPFPISGASHDKNDSKNHTSNDKTHKNAVTSLRSAKISPNTWKPKVSANMTETVRGETAIFTLPEDGLVLDKEYKIQFKVRVGRDVASGHLAIPVAFEGPGMSVAKQVFVEVK